MGRRLNFLSFNILDIQESGGDVLITTDLDPALTKASLLALGGSSADRIRPHPGKDVTFTNCTGSAEVEALSDMPANRVLGEGAQFNNMTFSQGYQAGGPGLLWGAIVSITVAVTTQYTGALSTLPLRVAGQSGVVFGLIVDNGATYTAYNPVVNLKVAGTRVITPAGVTGTQSGDSGLALPAGTKHWCPLTMTPYLNDDISGESIGVRPVATVTFVMDQGL